MKLDLKKIGSIVVPIVMGVSAMVSAISDQKKEAEFEDMKKALSELKNASKGES